MEEPDSRKGEKMDTFTQLTNGEFHIVAVKDELTGKFLQPTFGEDLDAIKRIFAYQINNNPIWKDNASDFSLYRIGLFHEKSGMIIPELDKLCSGNSVRKEN